jgi:hypothetical protein
VISVHLQKIQNVVLVKSAKSGALHTSAADVGVYAVSWDLRNPTKL